MRSCCAIYIDAGYLLASVASRVTGSSLRSGISVDHQGLLTALRTQVCEHSGLPLLRTMWYDSAPGRGLPTPEQEVVGVLAGVKLRLGRLSPTGEQKGVDLRLGLDLVSHARSGSIDAAYLVSGDDDLSEAVEEAQAFGVQVVAVCVPDSSGRAHGMAHHLRLTVDEVMLVNAESITQAVTRRERRSRPPATSVVPGDAMNAQAVRAVQAVQAVSAGGATVLAPSPATLARLTRHGATVSPAAAPSPAPAASLASGAPVAVVPVTSGPATPVAAWRSESVHKDGPTGDSTQAQDYSQQITAVVTRVLAVWSQTAAAADIAQLWRQEPSISSDVDRALLLDLSDALQVYDLPEQARHALRHEFWDQAGTTLDRP